jgi:hypothetical protein
LKNLLHAGNERELLILHHYLISLFGTNFGKDINRATAFSFLKLGPVGTFPSRKYNPQNEGGNVPCRRPSPALLRSQNELLTLEFEMR